MVVFAVLAGYPFDILLLGPQRVSGALQGYGFCGPISDLVPHPLPSFRADQRVLHSVRIQRLHRACHCLILVVGLSPSGMRRQRRRGGVGGDGRLRHGAGAGVATSPSTGLPTRIPLPWIIPEHLPVLDNILPVRLMVCRLPGPAGDRHRLPGPGAGGPDPSPGSPGLAATVVALVPLVPSLPISSAQFDDPVLLHRRLRTAAAPHRVGAGSPPTGVTPPSGVAGGGRDQLQDPTGLVFTPGPGGHEWNAELDPLGAELTALGEGATAPASALCRRTVPPTSAT